MGKTKTIVIDLCKKCPCTNGLIVACPIGLEKELNKTVESILEKMHEEDPMRNGS